MNFGYPVYIATKKYQCRRHKKKRINKKWQKRYGYTEYNLMPHGQVLLIDNVLYMTEKTFNELQEKKVLSGKKEENGNGCE